MKVLFVVVLCLIMSVGCSKDVEDKIEFEDDKKIEVLDKKVADREDIKKGVKESIKENVKENVKNEQSSTKEDTNSKNKEVISNVDTKKEVKYDKDILKFLKGEINGSMLDRQKLDKEDNKKYAWWIRLNDKNKPSEVPQDIQKIVDDYKAIYIGDVTKKKVYLTFDEGYENGYTPKILDTLKENNVKAIFFITSHYLKKNPELVKRMLDEGHKVGNHSVNHPSFPELDYDKLEKEMLDLEKDFYNRFGVRFSYMRPPRGEYSKRTLEAANQLGYKNVFWSYAYKDYDVNDQRGEDYAYNRVMGHLHNGMIVLLHAVSKDNANALDRIIKDIKNQGYEISPFDL